MLRPGLEVAPTRSKFQSITLIAPAVPTHELVPTQELVPTHELPGTASASGSRMGCLRGQMTPRCHTGVLHQMGAYLVGEVFQNWWLHSEDA